MLFGAMFHHFKYGAEERSPGAISGDQFHGIVNYLSRETSIVGPSEFRSRLTGNSQNQSGVVLTFDDGLASHYHLVRPILTNLGIQGIFAIYSSVFSSDPDPLELFGAFRNQEFESFTDFWSEFLEEFSNYDAGLVNRLSEFDETQFLSEFPFYTSEEKKFRYARDVLLRREEYEAIMWSLIRAHREFDYKKVVSQLWMSEKQVREIWEDGHEIALHSHTHPTRMDTLTKPEQEAEYFENFQWLSRIATRPSAVAHPCGRYDEITLDVLQSLGVDLGFKSTFDSLPIRSQLEVPRIDHTELLSLSNANGTLPG